MRLTKAQFKALYEALNEAFSTNESLEELARKEKIKIVILAGQTQLKFYFRILLVFVASWLCNYSG